MDQCGRHGVPIFADEMQRQHCGSAKTVAAHESLG
jgi:hypothetical protein